MNAIDYAIIIILLLSIGIGVIRGAIREVMNIAGWVLAFIVAHSFAANLAPMLADWVGEPVARMVLAWAALFLGVLCVSALLTSLVSEIARKLGLSTIDRGVGALIGFARGMLLLLAFTLVLGLTKIPQGAHWREATFTPWLEVAALYARGLLPDAIAAKIRFRVAGAPATVSTANAVPSKP